MPQRTVCVIFFKDFTPLDAYGPIQAFLSSVDKDKKPLYKIVTAGPLQGPISSGGGVATVAEITLDEIPTLNPDILIIPGGWGTRSLVNDEEFIQKLKTAAENSSIIATVCTGAALLARTGLLDGLPATSNKRAFDWVKTQSSHVLWKNGRWVSHIDEKTKTGIITSSGVSAGFLRYFPLTPKGLDMTLHLISILDGKEVAEDSANAMEFLWNREADIDPFERIYNQ